MCIHMCIHTYIHIERDIDCIYMCTYILVLWYYYIPILAVSSVDSVLMIALPRTDGPNFVCFFFFKIEYHSMLY